MISIVPRRSTAALFIAKFCRLTVTSGTLTRDKFSIRRGPMAIYTILILNDTRKRTRTRTRKRVRRRWARERTVLRRRSRRQDFN